MSDVAIRKVRTGELSEGMRPKKRTAFEALRGGNTFRQAAEAAGVNRATLYRWVQLDPKFRAAYNAWQLEIVESSRSRLLTFVEQAVEVVGKAIDRGDETVAVGVLRQLGIMRAPNRKSTDPEVVALQIGLDRRREQYRLSEQMAKHMLSKMGMTPGEQRQYIRDKGVEGLHKEMQKAERKALPPGPIGAEDKGTGRPGLRRAQSSRDRGSQGLADKKTAANATTPTPSEANGADTADAVSAAKALSEQQIREIAEAMADKICKEAAGAAPAEAPQEFSGMANS